jgi:3-dehydroquinate dehydratase I
MKPSLCGCLMEVPLPEFPHVLSHPGFDLLEWRLDSTLAANGLDETIRALALLRQPGRRPVLVTNRPIREGGLFSGTEQQRISILEDAVRAGAEWVDVELDVPAETLVRFQNLSARILLSHHDFAGTPDVDTLKRQVERMASCQTETLKVVTYAHSQDDNLRVLELIPWARREFDRPLVAFCMGPLGRWSRLVCLLLGSPWTYVQLPGLSAAAPGQLTLDETSQLWNLLSPDVP